MGLTAYMGVRPKNACTLVCLTKGRRRYYQKLWIGCSKENGASSKVTNQRPENPERKIRLGKKFLILAYAF